MSDRRADDETQPLAPRRTLSSPAGASAVSAPSAHPAPSEATTQDVPQVRTQSAAPVRTQDVPPSPVPVPPVPTGESASRVPAAPRPSVRKARLRVLRVDPWSVMKMAFALSVALAVVTVVAVLVLWSVLGAAGVWDAINNSADTVLEGNSAFDVTDYVGLGRVLGITMVLAAVDVVLITALATLGAFLYNLAASLLGGLEVTLAEDR